MAERQGDRTLEVLARDRGADLLAYATLITGGDRAAAQDLVQDAIVAVFGRMRTGLPPASSSSTSISGSVRWARSAESCSN